jgi:class 3 adenylate cyclase
MSIPLDPTLKNTEARLWTLIEERSKPGADVHALDERIWSLFGEDWAIMATDLSGFSRRAAEFGICHFLQVIWEHKKVVFPIVEAHDGILLKVEADSLLVLFRHPHAALRCAIAMQHACQQLSARRVVEEQILLCLGIGYGRILRVGESEAYGAEVNAASKLGEDIARASEILVTASFAAQVGDRTDLAFEALETQVPGCERAFRVVYPHA